MKIFRTPAWLRQMLAAWRGQAVSPVHGLAQKKLPFRRMIVETGEKIRVWGKTQWLVAAGLFFLLALVRGLGTWGAWFWLGLGPGVIGIMLCLAGGGFNFAQRDCVRIIVKSGMASYTILSWIFLNLILGIFVCLLISAFLYWGIQKLPSQRVGPFSLYYLAYGIPLIVLLGIFWKTLRFYLGTYFVLPLVVVGNRSIFSAIRASRAALLKSEVRIAAWMFLGWLVNAVPVLFFFAGILCLFFFGTKILPPAERSLWISYGYGMSLFLFSFCLALLVWPIGFAMKMAAYQRVFENFKETGSPAKDPS